MTFFARPRQQRRPLTLSACVAGLTLAASPAVLAQASPLTDVITVTGQRTALTGTQSVSPDSEPVVAGADTTALIARLPGAASLGNGVLSGQVQYRGLFGDRLNIRINGQSFASGGPNLMDPPLHYAPVPLIERIEVDRGVSPVSAGPDSRRAAPCSFDDRRLSRPALAPHIDLPVAESSSRFRFRSS